MTDPKRLLEEQETLTLRERTALEAETAFEPPRQARAVVWQALVGRLPPPPSGGGPSDSGGNGTPGGNGADGAGGTPLGSGASGSSGGPGAIGARAGYGLSRGFAAKLGTGVSAALVVAGVVTAFVSIPTQRSPALASRVELPAMASAENVPSLTQSKLAASAPSAEQTTGVRASEPVHPPRARRARSNERGAPAPSTNTPEVTATFPDARDVSEESRLLTRARDELQAGRAEAALGTLELARARFPRGVLVQEREALVVEALAQAGRTTEARTLGRGFLSQHPESPHASRIRDALSR